MPARTLESEECNIPCTDKAGRFIYNGSSMTDENRGILFGMLAITLFGFSLPLLRIIVPYLNPVFVGFGRAVMAGILAIPILIISKQSWPNKSQLKKLLLIAMGVVIGFPVFSSLAMVYLPASHGGVVLALLPLCTAVMGTLFSRERPSWGFWLSCLVGTVLVLLFSLMSGGGSFHIADLALLVAILLAALGYAVGGNLAREMGGWQVICWAVVVALPLAIVPTYLLLPSELTTLPLHIWLSFILLTVNSQLIGFIFWYKGLALGGVTRVSQCQLLQPFVTITLSAFLLGESVNTMTFIFAALVVATVAVNKRMQVRR